MEGRGRSVALTFVQHPHRSGLRKFLDKTLMINNLIQRAKSTFSQPTSQPEAIPAPEPKAIPSPAPTEPAKPTPEPAPIDLSPRELALRAAEAAGWKAGDVQVRAKILRHQPSKMFLLVEVENWGEPVICHVKDAQSWLPVNPPFDTLDARFSGTATADGKLLFDSTDVCKAGRLRRAR